MQDLFHPQYGDIVAERLLIGYCKELYYSAIGFAHIRESYQPTRIVRWERVMFNGSVEEEEFATSR